MQVQLSTWHEGQQVLVQVWDEEVHLSTRPDEQATWSPPVIYERRSPDG